MKVYVLVREGGHRTVRQVGEFKVGERYLLTGGYHRGKMLRLNYISPFKQVMLDGVRHRLVHGTLVGESVRINSIIAHLQ